MEENKKSKPFRILNYCPIPQANDNTKFKSHQMTPLSNQDPHIGQLTGKQFKY